MGGMEFRRTPGTSLQPTLDSHALIALDTRRSFQKNRERERERETERVRVSVSETQSGCAFVQERECVSVSVLEIE